MPSDQINGLVGTGLSCGQANSLIKGKLAKAIHQLDKKKPDARKAVHYLNRFLATSDVLPVSVRQAITDEILRIIEILEGSCTRRRPMRL